MAEDFTVSQVVEGTEALLGAAPTLREAIRLALACVERFPAHTIRLRSPRGLFSFVVCAERRILMTRPDGEVEDLGPLSESQ